MKLQKYNIHTGKTYCNWSLHQIVCTKTIISDVCTKYQEASKIVNLALQGLISQCVPGAKIVDLCKVNSQIHSMCVCVCFLWVVSFLVVAMRVR